MGGPRLTPAQLREAARVYAETNSYSGAARALGVAVTTVRDALLRVGIAKDRTAHARACARGIREGRRALRHALTKAVDLLDGAADPRGYDAVASAVAKVSRALVEIQEHADRRRASRIARTKARVEIAILRRKLAGPALPEIVVLQPDDPRYRDLQRQLLGAPRQGLDGRDGTADGVAGRDVPPVPAPLDSGRE